MRSWGPPGNERLTAATAMVLVGLLVVEAATTISLHSTLPVHLFLGMLLVVPVALKLTSTGWRFVSYYSRNPAYVAEGPPQLALRLLAPVLVLSTLTLFGSGVALVIGNGEDGWLVSVHAVSFAVWGVAAAVHTLAYARRVQREGPADWRRQAAGAVPGARIRRWLVAGALALGLVVGAATYPLQRSWLDHHHHGRSAPHDRAIRPLADGASHGSQGCYETFTFICSTLSSPTVTTPL